jgi:Flp pilus assembly protein TadG
MITTHSSLQPARRGNVLVLLAVLLPVLIGVVGLVIDGGMMMDQRRDLQHATDAAATSAATELRLANGAAAAQAVAIDAVTVAHEQADADVTVHIPPTTGPFAGDSDYVEVVAESVYRTRFMPILGGALDRTLQARSVAGVRNATAEAAIVVLDPSPSGISVASASTIVANINLASLVNQLPLSSALTSLGLGGLLNGIRSNLVATLNGVTSGLLSDLTLPALPTLTAGLEVEGLGSLKVDGAILVNTEWGGQDEHGSPAGVNSPLPYGAACMPLLATTKVFARDVRVVGGVDALSNYDAYQAGGSHPVQANRLAVPDPLKDISTPTIAGATAYGHQVYVKLISLSPVLGSFSALLQGLLQPVLDPILLNPAPLNPGVYDSITVVSLGEVKFNPGTYIIRSRSPITQMSLCVVGGWVKADGVLFYVTDSATYNASSGSPDASDNHNVAPANLAGSVVPSVLLAPLLPGSSISGLSNASSPFNGMLIYQRRVDRRPIVVSGLKLLGGGAVSGTIYAKWGHVIFLSGLGTYDLRFVCGTMRVLTIGETTLAPTKKFAAARDVYLVE